MTKRSQFSDLTADTLDKRLYDIGWKPEDFIRFAIIGRTTMARYRSGEFDGKIPMLVERALMLAETFPHKFLVEQETKSKEKQGIDHARERYQRRMSLAQVIERKRKKELSTESNVEA